MEDGYNRLLTHLKNRDMKDTFSRHVRFTNKVFPGHSIKGIKAKLRKEVTELNKANYKDKAKKELIDVLLVTFSYANLLGMDYEEVIKLANRKIEINENRKWIKQSDGSYQHVKQK